jgi:hypothetical protein
MIYLTTQFLQEKSVPNRIMKFNVGGTLFTTTLRSLTSCPGSMISNIFDPNIEEGEVPFLDDEWKFYRL